MSEPGEYKNCKHCGKKLPQEAIFCYYCNRELVTRPERPAAEPAPESPVITWILIAVGIGVAGLLLFLLLT